ncbi:MAG TPA: hypothetical protein VNT31_06570 [Nocardioides sp.]|nr:hypothetical protein [Nocardioides sp.]
MALLVTLLMVANACSDGGDGDRESRGETPSSSSPAAPGAESVRTTAELGKVRGRLPAARSADVLANVTKIIESWTDAAYAGDYPRTDFAGAFAAFTADARALAVRQSAVLTNAAVGADLDAAEITRRVVRVDVLAPKGRLAGATARVHVTVELSGGVERTDVVRGRLLLTPSAKGWRVFGFDLSRNQEAS